MIISNIMRDIFDELSPFFEAVADNQYTNPPRAKKLIINKMRVFIIALHEGTYDYIK